MADPNQILTDALQTPVPQPQLQMPAGWTPGGSMPPGVPPDLGPPSPADANRPPSIPTGRPMVMRSLLGTFLAGIQASLSAPRGPQGQPIAAQQGAAAGEFFANPMQRARARDMAQQEQEINLSTKKAQLAVMQINMQKEIALWHTLSPQLQDGKWSAWQSAGKNYLDNVEKGNGEIMFQTEDPQALYSQWHQHLKDGDYNVAPFAFPDSTPDKPRYGLFHFKDASTWDGGDTYTFSDGSTQKIPNGGKGMKVSDVIRWAQGIENNKSKAAIQKEKDEAAEDRTSEQIAGRKEVALINANSRERVAYQRAKKQAETDIPIVQKQFAAYEDAISRVDIMRGDLASIKKNPTGNIGSFDMDLLSQHIALTFGTVKGIRGGQQLIEYHLKARGLDEATATAYAQIKNGSQLSNAQRENFLDLAIRRAAEEKRKYEDMHKQYTSMPTASPSPGAAGASGIPGYEFDENGIPRPTK